MVKADLEHIYLAAYERENDKELDVDVCLLNLSERPQVVEVMQGSYEGDTDGVMDLGHSKYKTIALPAKGFQRIDHFDDEGQLDFTTWYIHQSRRPQILGTLQRVVSDSERERGYPASERQRLPGGLGKIGKPDSNNDVSFWRRRGG